MKKKILSILGCFCFLIFAGVCFAGCGEQFIEERTYQLINMQVIKDNTSAPGYVPFEEGAFADSFTGSMSISQCTIQVGRETSTLVYDDTENSGLVVSYVFDVYTDDDVYPAYSFTSYEILLNDVDVKTLPESTIQDLPPETRSLYTDILVFTNILQQGNASIQLVTQNRAFACSIVLLNQDGSLAFMGNVYGY